jgi:4'-phosphopantetheinyl transferase
MAVIQIEKIDNGLFGLWKITEEIEELLHLSNLSAPDMEKWSAIKAIQRKKEWLATRVLLNELTGQHIQIRYFADGRPFLENHASNISISHTKGYAAVLLHNKEIPGIDIELDSRSAEKVAERILSPEELDACRENEGYSNKKLLIHWCAKEAIFKIVPENGVSYLKQIRISLNGPVGEPHSFAGTFHSKSGPVHINLFYKSTEELIMVWGWPTLSARGTEIF